MGPHCAAQKKSIYLLRVNQISLEMYLKDIKILLCYIHGINYKVLIIKWYISHRKRVPKLNWDIINSIFYFSKCIGSPFVLIAALF